MGRKHHRMRTKKRHFLYLLTLRTRSPSAFRHTQARRFGRIELDWLGADGISVPEQYVLPRWAFRLALVRDYVHIGFLGPKRDVSRILGGETLVEEGVEHCSSD